MKFHGVLILMIAGVLSGCGVEKVGKVEQKPVLNEALSVAVVNYPLMYFAERIGGGHVELIFLVPADEDPAFWSPDAEAIAAYQQADLILLNGAGYAKWIERASLPPSRIENTSAGISDQLITLTETATHSHGPEGKHEHTGYAFTTWLDFELAKMQAQKVADALIRIRPELEADFRAGLTELEADLDSLDQRFNAATEKLGSAPLIYSHPVYQYLNRRYNLNGLSVHWEPDELPNMDELHHLLDQHPAQWVVWEGQPLTESTSRLEAAGIGTVVFDPCGNRPVEGDFLTVMEANAQNLEGLTSNPEDGK